MSSPSSSHKNDTTTWTSVGVTDDRLTYEGNWTEKKFKNGNIIKGTGSNASVSFGFQGTRVKVIGFLDGNSSSSYFLDSHYQQKSIMEVSSSSGNVSQTFFLSNTLKGAEHTLLVAHNPSDGGFLWLDEFQVVSWPQTYNDMESGSPNQAPMQSSSLAMNPVASSSPPPNPPPSSSDHGHKGGMPSSAKKLDGGIIALIVLSSLMILVGIIFYIAYLHRRKATRRRAFYNPERDSGTTFVHIIGSKDDLESPMVETRAIPGTRRSILPWLRSQYRQSSTDRSRTLTDSIIFSSAFLPTEPMSSIGGEQPPSPGPAVPSKARNSIEDDTYLLPRSPRTAHLSLT